MNKKPEFASYAVLAVIIVALLPILSIGFISARSQQADLELDEDSKRNREMMRVIQQRQPGDTSLSQISTLLDQGAYPNAHDRSGNAALIIAAGNEDPQLVALLLSRGASPNITGQRGRTALMAAATYNLSEGDFGDFVSQGDISKRYPIIEVMPLLLDHGADPNLADKDGITPLMLAAGYAQCPKAITLLLKHGARPNARTKSGGMSALSFALQCRDSGPERDNHETIALLKQAGAKE